MNRHIPYYESFVSNKYLEFLLGQSTSHLNVEGIKQIGESKGLETKEALQFICDLYNETREELSHVLEKRRLDRKFIDERVPLLSRRNKETGIDYISKDYENILGLYDENGEIVAGPKLEQFYSGRGHPQIAEVPTYLRGPHITLFGPPADEKMCINAMNSYHRKIKNEPASIEKILSTSSASPFWGADNEDSKTPMRDDLVSSGENLGKCFEESFEYTDPKSKKNYRIEKDFRSLPLKRFPGLALPSTFLFYEGNPLPLHLYDFALHLFHYWDKPEALNFYVPKLETEFEARYIKNLMETAERLIKKNHKSYSIGTIRLMIVLENPRAIFRANEIITELYPYFVGASLGWHDFLGSTARLFKEDSNYRIPVKADPNIVIKYIKASHELLSGVVGQRGGIKVGGMYGVLPVGTELNSPSFQITLRGYFKDVITQLRRGLNGFWVAHPDFVRIGMAMAIAWEHRTNDKPEFLNDLIDDLLDEPYRKEIKDFIDSKDIEGLDFLDEMFARSLIVSDIKESDFIKNNDPEEIRYNVFQTLQYLTDWLCGNGCVALPHQIDGVAVRVMDDLATAERSRWEVWHELYHGRFSLEEFVRIVHEELLFIRKDHSNDKKIVQVKYNDRTSKWYPVAAKLMLHLMGNRAPVEFATELLLPFTNDKIRNSEDPWSEVNKLDNDKYKIDKYLSDLYFFFEMCGEDEFAKKMASNTVYIESLAKKVISNFTKDQIISASSFHGNIGESVKNLDAQAKSEQKKVSLDSDVVKNELLEFGTQYLNKFGIKYLISAKGKSSNEINENLLLRLGNSLEEELDNARSALFEITKKRIDQHMGESLYSKIEALRESNGVVGAQITISSGNSLQQICFGEKKKGEAVDEKTLFQAASLSKSIGTTFCLEYFRKNNISLEVKVNDLLKEHGSKFRLKSGDEPNQNFGDQTRLNHLMNHTALNLHYVNGVESDESLPPLEELVFGNESLGYEPVAVISKPGESFNYSGAGFIVLQYLMELILGNDLEKEILGFCTKLGMKNTTFFPNPKLIKNYALGHTQSNPIKGDFKIFPAFAAGAMCTTKDMHSYLAHLGKSYKETNSGISHDVAVEQLHGLDLGSIEFMSASMGQGIFTIEAGDNKFMLHQGANDGFRGIFLHCFDGPDYGKGVTIFSNSDNEAVPFIAKAVKLIFKSLHISGIDYKKLDSALFDSANMTQENIVNFGYKNLLLDGFQKTSSEEIDRTSSKLDSLSEYNLIKHAEVASVTNDRFARAENCVSQFVPVFDPALFGKQGKIMDSWESARHSLKGKEELVLKFQKEITPRFLSFCTKYHLGNQVEYVEVLAYSNNSWEKVISKTKIEGHSVLKLKVDKVISTNRLKVITYPDGGLSRIGVFDELPEDQASCFDGKSKGHKDEIPQVKKPIGLDFNLSDTFIVEASNEHYSPAKSILSPYEPVNMFDGFETARSRKEGNEEFVIVGFKELRTVSSIEIDFTFFVNNNPNHMKFLGLKDGEWIPLTGMEFVKPFAGNKKVFNLNDSVNVSQVKIMVYPDGGFNRVKFY